MDTLESASRVKVWDPLVRIGHWLLVAGFFTNYIMEDEWMGLHSWIGYTLMAVVLVRLSWGFVGTRHARFSDFVRSPLATARYLGDLARGRARRYIGHNPAGAVMILLLLACMASLAFSGMVLYAVEDKAGPLAGWVVAQGDAVGQAAWVVSEDFWEEAHEALAQSMLALVVFHVIGVVVSSRMHRENLVAAMVTGRKRAPVPGDGG